jgi:hypothetical protein
MIIKIPVATASKIFNPCMVIDFLKKTIHKKPSVRKWAEGNNDISPSNAQ